MDIDVSAFPDRATSLEETSHNIRIATNPSAADTFIAGQLDEFKAQFNFHGVDVAPTSAIATAEERLRTEYDANLLTSITQYEGDLTTFVQEVDRSISAAEEVPVDPALHAQHDQVRLMARQVQLAEQDQAERHMGGQTRRTILTEYLKLPDGEAARVIEREVLNDFRHVSVKAERGDESVIVELKNAVKARREARARAAVPEAFDAKARIAALRRSATGAALRDHMKSGRGVAGLRVVHGGSR